MIRNNEWIQTVRSTFHSFLFITYKLRLVSFWFTAVKSRRSQLVLRRTIYFFRGFWTKLGGASPCAVPGRCFTIFSVFRTDVVEWLFFGPLTSTWSPESAMLLSMYCSSSLDIVGWLSGEGWATISQMQYQTRPEIPESRVDSVKPRILWNFYHPVRCATSCKTAGWTATGVVKHWVVFQLNWSG